MLAQMNSLVTPDASTGINYWISADFTAVFNEDGFKSVKAILFQLESS
jgi:hypothetical protein